MREGVAGPERDAGVWAAGVVEGGSCGVLGFFRGLRIEKAGVCTFDAYLGGKRAK